MNHIKKLVILLVVFIVTKIGFGQDIHSSIIDKVIYDYLETLLKTSELKSSDTLFIKRNFRVENLISKYSNIRIISDEKCSFLKDKKANYYILNYELSDLHADSLKMTVMLNRFSDWDCKTDGTSTITLETEYSFIKCYWINYDCEEKEWKTKK